MGAARGEGRGEELPAKGSFEISAGVAEHGCRGSVGCVVVAGQRMVLRRRSAAEQKPGATRPSIFFPKESPLPALPQRPERHSAARHSADSFGCACTQRAGGSSRAAQPAARHRLFSEPVFSCFHSHQQGPAAIPLHFWMVLLGGVDGL